MSHQDLVRDFYAARARRDWDAVAALLVGDIAWHEPGAEDYSGSHHGLDAVLRLLKRLVEVTEGTFSLEPTDFITTSEHTATNARWTASRGGVRVEGNELAVFRIADARIAEAWFHPDGYDPEALSAVFSFKNP
ncbi:nuclear transport factor 2 family protein [Actinomadura rubrisoli]|nr:nuclear transport factor 2 family protein [Actinomadura rubrisoli]